MKTQSNSKQETLVYLILWATLFVAPVISFYIQNVEYGSAYSWEELFHVWKQFAIALIAFLIHNFILAPLLVNKQRYVLYFGTVAALVSVFALVQCVSRPAIPRQKHHEHKLGDRPPHKAPAREWPQDREDFIPHPHDGSMGSDFNQKPDIPRPLFFSEHDLIATIMLFMMLGLNLGVKLFFRQRDNQRRLVQLEKENLTQQLEYLKYQINPHFLMNTLNNIHALVDIDQEKAKKSIVELSKIMRYVLYDGARETVQLRRETEFVENYIHLMRLRYSSRVDIRVDIPRELPDSQVPPLLLISFIENAFKHGVSYQQESFIHIAIRIEGKLLFDCRNSKKPQSEDEHGGVGLQNVKRRLKLIYGNDYVLNIHDTADTYNIHLEIPLK